MTGPPMPRTIGVPTEIKEDEGRVAIAPAGVQELTRLGHRICIQSRAGHTSGIPDAEFEASGAEILPDAPSVFAAADVVVKVKEPLPAEYPLVREGQIIFTFFHFAASRELTEAMMASGASCVAYETIQDGHGRLPLLTPMSEVAGRMAVFEGSKHLESPFGGRGVLISGVPGVEAAKVVILGGGVVGMNAALIAAGLGAQVSIFDIDAYRLRHLSEILPPNVTTIYSSPLMVQKKVRQADLVIGAVLLAGAKAPTLVSREDVREMKDRSVIVDVAVDQGGCIETCRPTTHREPTYLEEGVLHYCVANMPGAVARTSTFALTNATLPYLRVLANDGIQGLFRLGEGPAKGLNVDRGKLYHGGVASAFELDHTPLSEWIGNA